MMIINLSLYVLLASLIGVEPAAIPCKQYGCSNILQRREASPAIPLIPIKPLPPPKPIVPGVGLRPGGGAPGVGNPGPMPEIIPNPPPKPAEPLPPPKGPEPVAPPNPPESAPGSGPVCKRAGCDGQVTPFEKTEVEAIRKKGETSQNELENAQAVASPRDVERGHVAEKYKISEHEDEFPYFPDGEDKDFWLNMNIQDFKYESNQPWQSTAIRNKGASESGIEDNVILSTIQRPESNAIIISESRAANDKIVDSTKRLRWSDMVMDTWIQASVAKNHDPANLKYMIRDNIRDGPSAMQTRMAMESALVRINSDGKTMQTFRSDPKVAGNDELAGYQLIAGTAHGDRVLKMLTDHPVTMKNVRIESFNVFTPKTVPGPGEYSIVIKFYRTE